MCLSGQWQTGSVIRKCLQLTLVTLVVLKSHSALTRSEVSLSSTFPQVTCPIVELVSAISGNWNNLMCIISVSEIHKQSFHSNVVSCLYPLTALSLT